MRCIFSEFVRTLNQLTRGPSRPKVAGEIKAPEKLHDSPGNKTLAKLHNPGEEGVAVQNNKSVQLLLRGTRMKNAGTYI